MKKITAAGFIALMVLWLFSIPVFAAEIAEADIPIEIEGGGTAIITSEVNCPLPDRTSVKIANGMTEHVKISFTEPGNYAYTIKTADKEGIYYSPANFYVRVTVYKEDNGEQRVVIVITKEDGGIKYEDCRFISSDSPPPPNDQNNPQTEPKKPEKNPPTSRPKTGDDSMLDLWLLICILASAGLFGQSVIYAVSTNRLIKSRS